MFLFVSMSVFDRVRSTSEKVSLLVPVPMTVSECNLECRKSESRTPRRKLNYHLHVRGVIRGPLDL